MDLNPNTPSEVITALAALCEGVAYLVFCQLGKSMNRRRPGQFNIGPRALGCIAVAVMAGWLVRYAQANLVDTAVYAALSAAEQGEYMGRLLRSIVVPAIIIIGVSAARAWRDKQERLAKARAAQART